MTLTLQAELAEPYVYLDNRALVLSNGPHGLIFHRAQGRWLAETLTIIAEEQRATRILQHRLFGGFVEADGAVVLFAGHARRHRVGPALGLGVRGAARRARQRLITARARRRACRR